MKQTPKSSRTDKSPKTHQTESVTQAERPPERHSRARRRLLQSMAAGGAAVTVKALPEHWAKPVLDVAQLPAHARATCLAETLTCQVDDIDYAWSGSVGNVFYADQAPPLDGGETTTIRRFYIGLDECLGTYEGVVTSATLSVDATVDPACGPVDLVASITGVDEFDVDSGGNQNGVVDPDSGAVAFNNVVVGVSLPDPSVSSTPFTINGSLDLTFSAPGTPDCVIDITLSEQTIFTTSCPPG